MLAVRVDTAILWCYCFTIILQGCHGIFIKPYEREVKVNEGEKASLTCSFGSKTGSFSYPLYEFFWLRNITEKDIDDSAVIQAKDTLERYYLYLPEEILSVKHCDACSIKKTSSSSTLLIHEAAIKHGGPYVCYMEKYRKDKDTAYGQINVVVLVPPQPTLKVIRNPDVNKDVAIRCDVPRVNPLPSHMWITVNGERENAVKSEHRNADQSTQVTLVIKSLRIPISREGVLIQCHIQWDGETKVLEEKVSTISKVSMPTNVKVVARKDSCLVQWKDDPNVASVTICMTSRETSTEKCFSGIQKSNYSINNLSEGVTYKLSLFARNRLGDSDKTKEFICLLGEFTEPRSVVVSPHKTSCSVTWQQDDHADSVTVCHDKAAPKCSTVSEGSHHTIRDLQMGVTYDIWLYANSQKGGKSKEVEGFMCTPHIPIIMYDSVIVSDSQPVSNPAARASRIGLGVSMSALAICVVAAGACITFSNKSKLRRPKWLRFKSPWPKDARSADDLVKEDTRRGRELEVETDSSRFMDFVRQPSVDRFVKFISFGEPTQPPTPPPGRGSQDSLTGRQGARSPVMSLHGYAPQDPSLA